MIGCCPLAVNKHLIVFLFLITWWCRLWALGRKVEMRTESQEKGGAARDSVCICVYVYMSIWVQASTDTVKEKHTLWPSNWGVLVVQQMEGPSVWARRQQPHSSSTLLLILCLQSVCVYVHLYTSAVGSDYLVHEYIVKLNRKYPISFIIVDLDFDQMFKWIFLFSFILHCNTCNEIKPKPNAEVVSLCWFKKTKKKSEGSLWPCVNMYPSTRCYTKFKGQIVCFVRLCSSVNNGVRTTDLGAVEGLTQSWPSSGFLAQMPHNGCAMSTHTMESHRLPGLAGPWSVIYGCKIQILNTPEEAPQETKKEGKSCHVQKR